MTKEDRDMVYDIIRKATATILGSAIVGLAAWTYSAVERFAVAEQRLQVVSELTIANSTLIGEMQLRMYEQNEEIVRLITKQDIRLTKLETIMEMMVTENTEQ